MGGKSQTTRQQVSIPPEVLARYNSVNQTAQATAQTPFQSYSSDPAAFVAPLNATQQAGISNTNAAAGQAQPYFGAATGQLLSAQGSTAPYFGAAGQDITRAQGVGNTLAGLSAGSLGAAANAADPYNAGAGQSINGAQGAANPYNTQAAGQFSQGLSAAQPYNANATAQIGEGYANAQPFNSEAAGQFAQGLAGAQPFNQAAAGQISQGYNSAQPLNAQAAGQYDSGLANAQPYNTQAGQQYGSSLTASQPYNAQAAGQYDAGLAGAQPYNAQAAGQYSTGLSGAQPYNAASAGQIYQGLGAATPLLNAANQNISTAQQDIGDPYRLGATAYGLAGSGAVDPSNLDAASIQKYLSPYLGTVLQGTAGLLNQQNQQQQAGQLGNAIRSGAFGGDRAGIAAGNLAQQQQLANANIFSGILNQGYGQALSTAQQQQGVDLGASQANRAALQSTSDRLAALGQQGFGQQLATGQAQAALGQQALGQNLQAAQALRDTGQQGFNQNLSTGQAQAALGQQTFGQNLATGQAQQSLGQQIYGQQLGAGQAQQSLGQQVFGQNLATGQAQQGLGQQQYEQGLGSGQALQGLGQQIYGQNTGTGQALAGLGQQVFGQGIGAGQAQAAVGQQVYGQNTGTGAALAGLGEQVFGQGLSTGQAQAGLGQQLYGQGANTAAQLAGLGQQQFGQGLSASGAQQGLGQAVYGTGANTSAALAGLGQGAQGAALSGAQAQLAAGQQQQQTAQAGQTALYNQFLQQQSYPFQVAQFLANIAEGTGALSGSTTTTRQPTGLFAKGGKVVPFRRKGFADGGLSGFDPQIMAQMLANAQGMYGPYETASGSGPYGGGARVPTANLPVGELKTTGPLPAQPSGSKSSVASDAIAGGIKGYQQHKMPYKAPEEPYDPFAGDYADGGSVGLNIPDDKPEVHDLMTAPPLPEKKDNSSTAGDLAKLTMMFMGAKNGGRIGMADGGDPDAAEGFQLAPNAPGYVDPLTRLIQGYDNSTKAKRTAYLAAQAAKPVVPPRAAEGFQLGAARDATKARAAADRADPKTLYHLLPDAPKTINPLSAIGSGMGYSPAAAAPAAPHGATGTWDAPPARRAAPPPGAGLAPAVPPPAPAPAIAAAPPAMPAGLDPNAMGASDMPPPDTGMDPNAMSPAPGLSPNDMGVSPPIAAPAPQAHGLGALLSRAKGIATKPGGYLNDVLHPGQDQGKALISLLKGIGTAQSSPHAMALGAGLNAGAQGYQDRQDQLAELAKTRAGIELTGAQTGVANATAFETGAHAAGIQGVVPVPGKELGSPGSFTNIGSVMAHNAAPGTESAAASAPRALPGWVGPQGDSVAQDTQALVLPQERRAEDYTKAIADGTEAKNNMPMLDQFALAMGSLSGTGMAPDVLNQLKQTVLNRFNATMDLLPNGAGDQFKIMENELGNAGAATKYARGTAALREAGMGMRAMAGMNAIYQFTANPNMPQATALPLAAQDMVDLQREIDRGNYIAEVERRSSAAKQMPYAFSVPNANQAFESEHKMGDYLAEKDQLIRILNNKATVDYLKNPETRDAMLSSLERQYHNPNLRRYFTGSVQ